VNTEQNNVTVEACKTMYSALLTAQARGKSVQVTFNPAIDDCSALQQWRWAEKVNWIFLRS
jgi:sugar/nucleoside kinase (ribokinase family)